MKYPEPINVGKIIHTFKNTVQPKETLTPTCAFCKLWLKLIGDPPKEGASGLRWSLYPIRPKAPPIL